jgi:hypothetical protein
LTGLDLTILIPQNDAVDVSFYAAGTPPEGQPGGDGVLVGAQAGDEGLQCGFAAGGGSGHAPLEVAVAAFGHEGGEGADVASEGGQFR